MPNEEFAMTKEELSGLIYKKACEEQDKYRTWLLSLPPEEILKHTYEYTIREDILIALEFSDFDEDVCTYLLALHSPIAVIYEKFNKCDYTYMEAIYDTIAHCK